MSGNVCLGLCTRSYFEYEYNLSHSSINSSVPFRHEDKKYVVVAGLLKHSIPCWGYVVEEQPRTGRCSLSRLLKTLSPIPVDLSSCSVDTS